MFSFQTLSYTENNVCHYYTINAAEAGSGRGGGVAGQAFILTIFWFSGPSGQLGAKADKAYPEVEIMCIRKLKAKFC